MVSPAAKVAVFCVTPFILGLLTFSPLFKKSTQYVAAKPVTHTVLLGAEQLAVVSPLTPLHVQAHGPLPAGPALTREALPALHRLMDGETVSHQAVPLAVPQTPLMPISAEQLAFVPPFAPLQVQ